jgi:hypothetical protein
MKYEFFKLEQLTEPFFCASLNQPGIRISDNSFRITEFEIKVPGLSFHVLKFQNLNLCQIQNFDYIEGSKKYGFFGHSYFQFRFIFCALDTQAFAYPSSSLNGSNMAACHLRLRFIFCALDTQALACPSSSLNGSNMVVQTWRHVTFDSDSSFVPLTPRPSPAHPRHWMVQTWQHWIERSNDQGSVWVYNFKKCDLKIIILKCVIWKVIFKNGVKCLTKL